MVVALYSAAGIMEVDIRAWDRGVLVKDAASLLYEGACAGLAVLFFIFLLIYSGSPSGLGGMASNGGPRASYGPKG